MRHPFTVNQYLDLACSMEQQLGNLRLSAWGFGAANYVRDLQLDPLDGRKGFLLG